MKNEDIFKENNGKKFDIVLMNPPYDKNMHLKFVRKCINISKNIINISPIRWLTDPFAQDKRSTLKQYEDVAKHIKSVESLKNDKTLFDIAIYSDLGIYNLSDKETDFDYKNYWKKITNKEVISIIQKVCYNNKCSYLNKVIENNVTDDPLVPISLIAGGRGNLPIIKNYDVIINKKINGENWISVWNKDPKHTAFRKKENSSILNIKFRTYEEAKNFYNSYKDLNFFHVICDITQQQQHIQDSKLPFLNDYTHKITEEEMYTLFDLNNEEIKYIKNFKT